MVYRIKPQNTFEELCDSSTVDIELVEVYGDDQTLTDKINKALIGAITSKEYPTIEALLHANDNIPEATYRFARMDVLFIDENVLSVLIAQGEVECASYPLSGRSVLNFDLSTGEIIHFSSCISDDKRKRFEVIAGLEFIEKHKDMGYEIHKPSDFKVNDAFSFSNKGITFYLDKFETGPVSPGETDFFVPYSKFKHLIVPNSIFSKY